MNTKTTNIETNVTFNVRLNNDVPAEIAEELEEQCLNRAFEQYQDGYRQGELCEVYGDDEYRGWWTSTKESIRWPEGTMLDIVKLVKSGQRREALLELQESGYLLSDLMSALDDCGLHDEVIKMYNVAVSNRYIKF